MRGIIDKEKTKSLIETIEFAAPINKLKVNNTLTKKILEKGGTKSKVYELTKELAIEYCKALISTDKKNIDLINAQDKQDDMCDAFLQGFYRTICKKTVPPDVKVILDKVSETIEKKYDENLKKIKPTKQPKQPKQPKVKQLATNAA